MEVIASQVFAAVFVPRLSLVNCHHFDDRIHCMQGGTIKKPIEDLQVERLDFSDAIQSTVYMHVLVAYPIFMIEVISSHLFGSALQMSLLLFLAAQTSSMTIIDTSLSIKLQKCLSATIVHCAIASSSIVECTPGKEMLLVT